jgi:phage shock protein E
MIQFIKSLFKKTDYKQLIKNGAIIIDVRTPHEYDNGHIQTAKNIPLDVLPKKVDDLKKKNVTVITCCASGMRSGVAARILKSNGVTSINGGSWASLNNKI